jgi:hypothetical protein
MSADKNQEAAVEYLLSIHVDVNKQSTVRYYMGA